MTNAFTAQRIAIALGISKRCVLQTLSNVPPATVEIIRGQQANAWSIEQLPLRTARQLEARARKMGFRDVDHLLADSPKRFAPVDFAGKEVPISEIAQQDIDRAVRFKRALATTIRLKDELDQPDAKRLALASFRRELHAYPSEKTWTRWTRRVIRRDAGEERFDDLGLYFGEVVARKRHAGSVAIDGYDQELLDALDAVRHPPKPTPAEIAAIWATLCETLDELVAIGRSKKRAQQRLLSLIDRSGVAIARSLGALQRNLRRKYASWIAGGRSFTAVEDRRSTVSHNKIALVSTEDRHRLIGHAVIDCGGRLSQAYRDLRDSGGLSSDLHQRHISNPSSKSYVPKSIRRAVRGDIHRLKNIDRGEREHELRGAYVTRDWSGVAAGDWFQADDLTPPVYFWTLNELDNVEVMLGQFLPMIDELTSYVLGFVLIQKRNYDSLAIRSLITNVCSAHRLPRKGFSFERGIWQTSKILSGDRRSVDMNSVADTGLRRLGMRIRHANLPRAKVIERTLGQLQDLMEALPGYCGRDEVRQKEERFARLKLDIEAGRRQPQGILLNAEQVTKAYAQICDTFNETPQQGRRLNGLSPRKGWEQLQSSEPRARFNDATHYFLAADVKKLKVGRNGVGFKVGKQWFRYLGAETGRHQGETIYAWFNPQRPDFLACSINIGGDGLFVLAGQ